MVVCLGQRGHTGGPSVELVLQEAEGKLCALEQAEHATSLASVLLAAASDLRVGAAQLSASPLSMRVCRLDAPREVVSHRSQLLNVSSPQADTLKLRRSPSQAFLGVAELARDPCERVAEPCQYHHLRRDNRHWQECSRVTQSEVRDVIHDEPQHRAVGVRAIREELPPLTARSDAWVAVAAAMAMKLVPADQAVLHSPAHFEVEERVTEMAP
eukprot:CAMPEP_0119057932 /NCGR_PEP_ID=MMETSP1178-20130426/2326_1 /TAXON_ID=33656 /ORGANISM="unid sp, Strain CCMP2000" /LENGTH=212 /DNA_ID=CAMNT_0007038811 /DNA_START=275 /DNA_END=916 /DNA_ORIENTATION=+